MIGIDQFINLDNYVLKDKRKQIEHTFSNAECKTNKIRVKTVKVEMTERDLVDGAMASKSKMKKHKSESKQTEANSKTETKKKSRCHSIYHSERETFNKFPLIEAKLSSYMYNNMQIRDKSALTYENLILEAPNRFDFKVSMLSCGHMSCYSVGIFDPTLVRIIIRTVAISFSEIAQMIVNKIVLLFLR